MTDPTDIPDLEDGDLAGEYALGVLDAAGRAEAERRMQSEPAFARAVAWWEERLAPLAGDVAPAPPSEDLWPRIQALVAEPARPSAWNSLAMWRGLTAGALALAAACVTVVVLPRPAPPPAVATQPPTTQSPTTRPRAAEVALIASTRTQRPMLVATLDHGMDQVMLTPMGMTMPAGRQAELWVIPDGGRPVSLGVIPMDAPMRMPMPEPLRGQAAYAAMLAVTDEPMGGSPSGVPTGEMRAMGRFERA